MSRNGISILAVGDPASELYRDNGPVSASWLKRGGIPAHVEIVPWAEYAGMVFGELESGTGRYDIAMLPGFFWLPSMADKGWLLPVPADSGPEDILPSLWDELFFGGRRYLFPAFAEAQTVIYRRDLAETAGFGILPSPLPVSLFMDVAKALHDPPRLFGTQLKGGTAESFPEWLPFLASRGGSLFGKNEEVLFDSAAGLDSLRDMLALARLSAPDVHLSDNETVNALVREGKVGIVNHWSGQLGPLMDPRSNPYADRYGFTYLEHPWATVWSFGINAASGNPEAALAWAAHATNGEHDALQGGISGSPVRRGSYGRDVKPWYQAVLGALERKNSFPSFVRFADMAGSLYAMVTDVLAGSRAPEAALRETAARCSTT